MVLQFLKNALNEKEGEKGKKEGDNSGKERTENGTPLFDNNQLFPFHSADQGSSDEELSRLRLPVISKKSLVADSKLVVLLV